MLNNVLLLACLEGGAHVQVGRAHKGMDDAYKAWERFDAQISGFTRIDGKLRMGEPQRQHFIDGQQVRFYRLRAVHGDNITAEFGTVRSFPLSAIRYTNRKAVSRMTSKTPSGIARPKSPVFATWERARSEAKANNEAKGRGYRALKASTGNGYTVIFRPAVANNKQRRVREV